MALTLPFAHKGFTFPAGHHEITAAWVDRTTGFVTVDYLSYANRDAALESFNGNALSGGQIKVPFADLLPELVALKTAIEAKLQAQFPTATPADDAG